MNTSSRDFARLGWFWMNRGHWHGKQLLPESYFEQYIKPDVPRDLPRTKQDGVDSLAIGSYGGGSDQDFPGQGVYGFNWWFNAKMPSGEMLLPSLPDDAFCTIGHVGKEVMLVVPSWRMVVAARGDWGGVRLEKTKILAAAFRSETKADIRDLGGFTKWGEIEIPLAGPAAVGRGDPNPFAIDVDGVFTAPSGHTFTIPGFFDGDGRGGLDGNVWKVRFSADEVGRWSFRSQSENSLLDGYIASFTVTTPPDDAADFYRCGRLEAVGTAENKIRYLKFRDGPYWLKAGCDDPENFLGKYKHCDMPEKRTAAIDHARYYREIVARFGYLPAMVFNMGEEHNELVTSGEALCLANPGDVYGLYLPNGGQVTIELPVSGEYQFDWWNPASGIRAKFADNGRVAKGQRSFAAPTQGD